MEKALTGVNIGVIDNFASDLNLMARVRRWMHIRRRQSRVREAYADIAMRNNPDVFSDIVNILQGFHKSIVTPSTN